MGIIKNELVNKSSSRSSSFTKRPFFIRAGLIRREKAVKLFPVRANDFNKIYQAWEAMAVFIYSISKLDQSYFLILLSSRQR